MSNKVVPAASASQIPVLPLQFPVSFEKNIVAFQLHVVPYGVLGNYLPSQKGAALVQTAEVPDNGSFSFVDAAGLHHVLGQANSPPGGAARAIYDFVGGILHPVTGLAHFPKPVKASIRKPGDAKFHTYRRTEPGRAEEKIYHVVHSVGPDFRQIFPDPNDSLGSKMRSIFSSNKKKPMPVTKEMLETASVALGEVYKNTFETFISHALDLKDDNLITCLRLLPLSSGIFSGPLGHHMYYLTRIGITRGLGQLNHDSKVKLTTLCNNPQKPLRIELCIFMESEFEAYASVFSSETN